MSYEDYEFRYLPRIHEVAEDLVRRGVCANVSQAYRYQSRYNLQPLPEPYMKISNPDATATTERIAS